MKPRLFTLLALVFISNISAQDVTVRINPSEPFMQSQFEIGLTHTGQDWMWSNDEAGKKRMRQLLVDGAVRFQNIHLMGWGAGNPSPSPGVYDWTSLDMRIDVMRDMDAELILTLCTAPGWMKTSGDDWNMNDKVAPAHYQDFADLCVVAANRYPDIRYFQVWNELKGWWIGDIHGYTEFYNVVYDALRAVRPDAIICGPYVTGVNRNSVKSDGTLTRNISDAFDHFLENRHGADVINYDGWLPGWPPENSTLSEEELMDITDGFGNVTAALKKKTTLPVWNSEFYAAQPQNSDNEAFLVANHASAYYHALINGMQLALHWSAFDHVGLFVELGAPGGRGGTARPHYDVIAAFNHHFGPGTQLVSATSSDPDIEVLASAKKTMIINKKNAAVTADVNGEVVSLDSYQVHLMTTPVNSDVNFYQQPESRDIKVVYASSKPVLTIRTPAPSDVTIHIYNILGQQIRSYDHHVRAHSDNRINLMENSTILPPGIYFAHITGADLESIKRFVFMKSL